MNTNETAVHPTSTAPRDPGEPALDGVREVLVRVLDIGARAAEIDAATPLLGELPELDSLAVMELATAIEERFDITIDDADFTGEVFETVGSLAEFVEREVAARR